MSKELIERLREAAAQRVASTAMIGADDLIVAADALESQAATPSSHWRAEGATDPHAGHYDGERAALTMGNLTDDELANGAFMNYDMPLNLAGILAGTHASPIAWMTAVKDRIRWLSRSLEKAAKAEQERDALALRVSELACRIDRAEEAMVERDALAAKLKALRGDQTPTTEDINLLKWKGMEGVFAFHLIERHADDWNHVARLMNAWLQANREDLAAELKALREQVPFDAGEARFRDAFDAAIRRGDWPSARNGYGYRSPMTQMAWQASFCTVNRLGLYAHPVPARELTDKECASITSEFAHVRSDDMLGIARAIERYLKGEGK